jgi:DNA-directed RNA polymerase subunit omega
MARVTVEDCTHVVENRFALCILTVKRARQLMAGGRPIVEKTGDKFSVLALREIATGKVGFDRPVKDVLEGKYEPAPVASRLVPAGARMGKAPPSGGLF